MNENQKKKIHDMYPLQAAVNNALRVQVLNALRDLEDLVIVELFICWVLNTKRNVQAVRYAYFERPYPQGTAGLCRAASMGRPIQSPEGSDLRLHQKMVVY
jgi:hypothetical protein